MTGVCAECGPTRLRWKATGAGKPRSLACGTKRRQDRDDWYERKGIDPGDLILRAHGLTASEARRFRDGKSCAICGETEQLHVDHDHETGRIRNVLCRRCNLGLGNFRESPELLARAIEYLKTHTREAAT